MTPFYVAASNGGLDGALDISQNIAAAIADRRAERVHGSRCRKIVDRLEILLIKRIYGFKSASFQQHIGDAHDCRGFELHLSCGLIIAHKIGAVKDADNIVVVVFPVEIDQFPGSVCKLLLENFVLDAILGSKHFGYGLLQLVVEPPQVRATGIYSSTRVRHIENIAQARVSSGLVQQGNALGTLAYIAVHATDPNVIFGAGGGIGPLGVDHELFREAVLVQMGSRDQKFRPVLPALGKTVRRAVGKGNIFFGFMWHLKPPFDGEMAIKRFCCWI